MKRKGLGSIIIQSCIHLGLGILLFLLPEVCVHFALALEEGLVFSPYASLKGFHKGHSIEWPLWSLPPLVGSLSLEPHICAAPLGKQQWAAAPILWTTKLRLREENDSLRVTHRALTPTSVTQTPPASVKSHHLGQSHHFTSLNHSTVTWRGTQGTLKHTQLQQHEIVAHRRKEPKKRHQGQQQLSLSHGFMRDFCFSFSSVLQNVQ